MAHSVELDITECIWETSQCSSLITVIQEIIYLYLLLKNTFTCSNEELLRAIRSMELGSNWAKTINSPSVPNFGRGEREEGGVVKLTKPTVSTLTSSAFSTTPRKCLWYDVALVMCTVTGLSESESSCFFSTSGLREVVGVRPSRAEGHFCLMFTRTRLCRPHCVQEWRESSISHVSSPGPSLIAMLRQFLEPHLVLFDNTVVWNHSWSSHRYGRLPVQI